MEKTTSIILLQRMKPMGRKYLFTETEKWCSKCSSWLPLDFFGINRREASGRQAYCKTCNSTYMSTFRFEHKYGVSPENYQSMLDKQGGTCAICGKKPRRTGGRLAIDHDHKTGVIRGLLCNPCNSMLGRLDEDPSKFERAIQYLKADFSTQI